MPSLEEVPFPVLILIAKSVPDLVSLHSLRLASPVCAALLIDVPIGAEIVVEVASLSMDEENQAIFWYIWQLLQGVELTRMTESLGAARISRYQHRIPRLNPRFGFWRLPGLFMTRRTAVSTRYCEDLSRYGRGG